MKKSKPVSGSIRVTLVKSPIGYSEHQKKVLKGLGLNKLHQRVELQNTAPIRGMINHVIHLVRYEVQA